MPFSNPIVAGETLVRESIQSPNYAPATAGWIVSADGTAEFSEVALRGQFIVNGPSGRAIRGYVTDPPASIPVIDFIPTTPANPLWTVSNGSIYEYGSNDYESLGLSSPVQYQPASTQGALIELRSGKLADPYSAIVMTAASVYINGAALIHGGSGMYYMHGQKGIYSVTAAGSPSAVIPVVFPIPFPAGVVPGVYLNIIGSAGPTARCSVRAINHTVTGFSIFVESSAPATNLAWVGVAVGWLAVGIYDQ